MNGIVNSDEYIIPAVIEAIGANFRKSKIKFRIFFKLKKGIYQ